MFIICYPIRTIPKIKHMGMRLVDSTDDICPNIKYDKTDKELVKSARKAQKDRYDKAMNKGLKAVKEGIEKGEVKKPPALV